MGYQATIGSNYEFPLSDEVYEQLNLNVGYILICEPLIYQTLAFINKI